MELPNARPYAFRFQCQSTALVIIDMQRDFVQPGGFGSIQCGDSQLFDRVRDIVPTVQRVLQACRKLGLHVMHTREGHRPDLSDLPASKRLRQTNAPHGHHTIGIGEPGPMGRLLVRGEYGHDIIDELKPLSGEVVIDKPGKGSFWRTGFHRALLARGITHLLLAGVTTECCVNTTAREAADRGFECCILNNCTSGFDADLVASANNTICAYDGLFGYVGESTDLISLLESQTSPPAIAPAAAGKSMDIASLTQAYQEDSMIPEDIVRILHEKMAESDIWTHVETPQRLFTTAKALQERFSGQPLPPLYGIPFAVTDDIDVASTGTKRSDPNETLVTKTSKVVDAFLDAGALFVGKINTDPRVHSPTSAIAAQVSFVLATDTTISSCVPANSSNLTIFKPTPGTLSSSGISLTNPWLQSTCIIAKSTKDARKVWLIADQGADEDDIYSKPQSVIDSWVWHVDFRRLRHGGFVFGIPKNLHETLEQHCTGSDFISHTHLYQRVMERLEAIGGRPLEVDWTAIKQAGDFIHHASVKCTMMELYNQRAKLTRAATRVFSSVDVLLMPATTSGLMTGEIGLSELLQVIGALDSCAINVASDVSGKQSKESFLNCFLVGATGRDGVVFDIACELQEESRG